MIEPPTTSVNPISQTETPREPFRFLRLGGRGERTSA